MSASTAFNRSVRDAGDLSDQKLFGSFRSLNRFSEEIPIPRSKYDEIFLENSINPVAVIPSQDEAPKVEKKSKSHSKEKHHRKGHRDHKEHQKEKLQNENENKDDDFMRHLGQRHERRRKKQVENEEANKEEDNVQHRSDSRNRRHSDRESESNRRRSGSRQRTRDNEETEKANNATSIQRSGSRQKAREETANRDDSSSTRLRSASRNSRKQKAELNNNDSEKEQQRANHQPKSKQQFMLNADAFSSLPPTPTPKSQKASESDSDSDDVEVKVNLVRSQESTRIEKIDFDTEYFKPIKRCSTLQFLLTPAPQGKIINCKIRKGQGILSDLQFYLEDYNGYSMKNNLEMLMKTHRRMATAKVYHLITACNYDEFWTKSPTEPTCGRIVSNISRKKFKLDLQYNDLMTSKEILSVEYKSTAGEPRKIMAKASLCSGTSNNQGDKITYILKNRQPHYDGHLRKFVLNYNGRAKLSSKHNFQIIDESFPGDLFFI